VYRTYFGACLQGACENACKVFVKMPVARRMLVVENLRMRSLMAN
jgi:hypothetical protein